MRDKPKPPVQCPRCKGSGEIVTIPDRDFYVDELIRPDSLMETCPDCNATGLLRDSA